MTIEMHSGRKGLFFNILIKMFFPDSMMVEQECSDRQQRLKTWSSIDDEINSDIKAVFSNKDRLQIILDRPFLIK